MEQLTLTISLATWVVVLMIIFVAGLAAGMWVRRPVRRGQLSVPDIAPVFRADEHTSPGSETPLVLVQGLPVVEEIEVGPDDQDTGEFDPSILLASPDAYPNGK